MPRKINEQAVREIQDEFNQEVETIGRLLGNLNDPVPDENRGELFSFAKSMWEKRLNHAFGKVAMLNKGLDLDILKVMLGFRHIEGASLEELEADTEKLLREARERLIKLVETKNSLQIANQKKYIKALENGLREMIAFNDALKKVIAADPAALQSDEDGLKQYKFQQRGAFLGGVLAVLASPLIISSGAVSGIFKTGMDTKDDIDDYIADKRYMFAVGSVVGGILRLPFQIVVTGIASQVLSVATGSAIGAHLAGKKYNKVYRDKCNLLYSISMLHDVLNKDKPKPKDLPSNLKMPTGILKYYAILSILNLAPAFERSAKISEIEEDLARYSRGSDNESDDHDSDSEDDTDEFTELSPADVMPTLTVAKDGAPKSIADISNVSDGSLNAAKPKDTPARETSSTDSPSEMHQTSDSSASETSSENEPAEQYVERVPSSFWKRASTSSSTSPATYLGGTSRPQTWDKMTKSLETTVLRINDNYNKSQSNPTRFVRSKSKTAKSSAKQDFFVMSKSANTMTITETDIKAGVKSKVVIEDKHDSITSTLPGVWFAENKSRMPKLRKDMKSNARNKMIESVMDSMREVTGNSVVIIGNCKNSPRTAMKLYKMALEKGLHPEYDADDGTKDAIVLFMHKNKRKKMF